jgi:transmembrane sensor
MSESSISQQAVDWSLRVVEPDFADWDAFTTWLEADPAHGEAYEAVMAVGEAADQALSSLVPASQATWIEPPSRRRKAWVWAGGGAIAASLAGLLAWTSMTPASDPYLIQTTPGGREQIAIAGTSITLNGDTRIWLDRRNPRIATIERGEALFDVRHDAARPFVVHAGDAELRDVGTRFDVTRDERQMRVAVAEGAVVFNPGREAVRVDSGRELVITTGADTAELRTTARQAVGSWRDGRFAYVKTPIVTIVADLTRSTGIALAVDPGVAAKTFTGVITFNGNREAFVADLGPLLGVHAAPVHGRGVLSRTHDDG